MLERLIGEDVKLHTYLSQDIGLVRVDPGQVEQILVNLAVNARHAMPDGGELTIETSQVVLDEAYCEIHADCQPGDYVLLAVSDTGCGMTPEIRSRVFEPFFTTKPKGQGTGMGLAMVYGAVKQLKGTIGVYSEAGARLGLQDLLPLRCRRSRELPSCRAPDRLSRGWDRDHPGRRRRLRRAHVRRAGPDEARVQGSSPKPVAPMRCAQCWSVAAVSTCS